jgi:hypothetical protein
MSNGTLIDGTADINQVIAAPVLVDDDGCPSIGRDARDLRGQIACRGSAVSSTWD